MQFNNAIVFVFIISLVGYLNAICTNDYLSNCFDKQSLCETVTEFQKLFKPSYTGVLLELYQTAQQIESFGEADPNDLGLPLIFEKYKGKGNLWNSYYELNDIGNNGTVTNNPLAKTFAAIGGVLGSGWNGNMWGTYGPFAVSVSLANGTVAADTSIPPSQVRHLPNANNDRDVIRSLAFERISCSSIPNGPNNTVHNCVTCLREPKLPICVKLKAQVQNI